MPYHMVHLNIAKGILLRRNDIKDISAYLLGTFAPDAVGLRSNYVWNDKKISHLLPGKEEWGGLVENNDEWKACALSFFRKSKLPKDFLLGYTIHILADVAWNTIFSAPFLKKKIKWAHEAYEIEKRMYHEIKNESWIWNELESAKGIDKFDLVSKSEMEAQVFHLCNKQYENCLPDNDFIFTNLSMDIVNEFIKNETNNIHDLLLPP